MTLRHGNLYISDPVRPIEQLAGHTFNGRWKVIELVQKRAFQTGSCFSVGYVVEDESGNKAFAKVLDFSSALQAEDTARALNEMTDTYIFERSLLELCGTHRLTKIVKGLDYGEITKSDVPLGKLFYIVFEIADGDVRQYMTNSKSSYLSWRLRVLHDIAIGLNQLHSRNIVHQDVKPSNILIFGERDESKLGDLGRAHSGSLRSPHDGHRRPGAFYYAPPEQLYEHQFEDRLLYRLAGDMYLLGSMLDFFITGTPTTVRLIEQLQDAHKPFPVNVNGWRGFFREVLPYLQSAHVALVEKFAEGVKGFLASSHGNTALLTQQLVEFYQCATSPDPMLRGHPSARAFKHGSPYDLQRFISGFDILSRKIHLVEKQR